MVAVAADTRGTKEGQRINLQPVLKSEKKGWDLRCKNEYAYR
jgi:hypothetical protein